MRYTQEFQHELESNQLSNQDMENVEWKSVQGSSNFPFSSFSCVWGCTLIYNTHTHPLTEISFQNKKFEFTAAQRKNIDETIN